MRDGRWGLGGMASGPGRGEALVPEEIDVGLHLPHPPPPPPSHARRLALVGGGEEGVWEGED